MQKPSYTPYDPLRCLNCGSDFTVEVEFCPVCGQKNRKKELTIVKWLQEGLSTFFHVEGKSWNTLKDLPIPGRIVTNFFNGKRERYVHPFRLLVFSSLVCLATITMLGSSDKEGFQLIKFSEDIDKVNTKSVESIHEDSLKPAILNSFYDHPLSSKMKTIDILRARIVQHDQFRMLADSLESSGFVSERDTILLDSLRRFFPMPASWIGGGSVTIQEDTFNFPPRLVAFASPAEVVKDHQFSGWIQKLIAKKAIQLYQGGSSSLNEYLFANLSWAILIFVPFLALGYKIFYRKRLPFFTQHLTYSAILMSVALLLFAVGYLISKVLDQPATLVVLLIIFLPYNIIGDHRIFKVSFGHVLWKSSLLGIYSLFAFVFALFIWILGAVLLA